MQTAIGSRARLAPYRSVASAAAATTRRLQEGNAPSNTEEDYSEAPSSNGESKSTKHEAATSLSTTQPQPPSVTNHSASAKLFADAASEETSLSSSSTRQRPAAPIRGAFDGPEEPWTGDESVQDAVLRMLVDKYKPLRGEFVTADERLKRAPPSISTASPVISDEVDLDEDLGEAAPLTAHLVKARAAKAASISSATSASVSAAPDSAFYTPPPPSGALANVPLLPSIEGHRPWHTTYVAPKHAASIKLGRIIPSSQSKSRKPNVIDSGPDGQPLRKDVAKLRRRMQAVRLTTAREGTLDYKLGLRRGAGLGSGGGGGGGANSIRVWNSLVEERIEVCSRRRTT
jgi:DnaJ family protein C protein 28